MTEQDLRVRLELGPEEALAAVEHAAEFWDAEWHRHGTGGRLELPVVAGLRRGTISARLSAELEDDATTLTVRIESSRYKLQNAAVSILALGGFGGLCLTLWPLYPPLLALAPVALILLVVAWLVIASRLQNSGLEEFLELVESAESEVREPHPVEAAEPNLPT